MKEITPQQLAGLLEAGEPLTVADIRGPEAYADWHIAGAVNLPIMESLRRGDPSRLRAALSALPQDRRVVFVCNRGVTSLKAAAAAEPLGYDVTSLIGGMRGWSGASTEARIPLRTRGALLIQVRRNGKGCLSYLIGSAGRAAVVDPCLDESVYAQIATREGLTIEAILETHVHADHISRARALADATGAALYLPENRRVTYEYRPLRDGDRLRVGGVEMSAITTPGHTGESTCYLVAEEAILTGDTLFADSVGRPDLEKGDAGAEAGARALHRSLRERLGALSPNLLVCPGHSGSPIGFDGAPIAVRLGVLRGRLELLMLEEEPFVRATLAGLADKPPSFATIIRINEGKADLGAAEALDLEAGPNRCAVLAHAAAGGCAP